ncbi:helix-turn-helix transcriptional regulator [Ramlibacter albus]|uniref:Helix-turn-helix transcriptional regulator n=1 Tax=Ramlibacter albus TaxID=2079448 RepID=A0A923M8F5_9BURK|nr:helix-turn-helix transcriptional regulator [Ramlibacter albus]MBC5765310.1 helix-turn-helix transcriptional regulator [Ramlibacter albus]
MGIAAGAPLHCREPDPDWILVLVASLYGSIEEPERLRESLRLLGDMSGADCTQLLLIATDTGWVADIAAYDSRPGEAVADEKWLHRWDDVDLSLSSLQPSPAGRIFGTEGGLDAGFLGGQAFAKAFLGGDGFGGAVAGVVSCDASTTAVLVQLRSRERLPFGASAGDTLAHVLPHVARASRVRTKLGTYAWAASPARLLNMLPLPCMLTDNAGRCLERNGALEEAMHALDMKVSAGRARFADTYLQDSWQAALAEVHHTSVPTALLATSEAGRQWKVHLTPVSTIQPSLAGTPLILMVMEERGSSMNTAANGLLAAATSTLTRAENEVLAGLLRGHTAKLIARARNASVNTVRSQIMAILEKTGHHTQKELIASFGASSFGASTFGDADGFSVSQPSSRHR